jgi:hypothetical protein
VVKGPGEITGGAPEIKGAAQAFGVEVTDFFIPEGPGPAGQGRAQGGVDVAIAKVAAVAEEGEEGLVVAGVEQGQLEG